MGGKNHFNQTYSLRASFESREMAFKYLFSMGFARCDIFMTRLEHEENKTQAHVHNIKRDSIIHRTEPYYPILVVYYSETVERLRSVNWLPRPDTDMRTKRDIEREMVRVNYAG